MTARVERLVHLPGVDVLRGLAIIPVLLHHTGIRIPMADSPIARWWPETVVDTLMARGFEGVYVFFAVSGFLIAGHAPSRRGALGQVAVGARTAPDHGGHRAPREPTSPRDTARSPALNHSFDAARRSACVLLLACLAPLAVRAGDDAAKVRAIVDAAILPLMAQQDIPGMAIGLTLGERTYVLNYGLAAREPGRPVTDATLFEIGSVSKTLTATLATYAQETGRLALSDHPGRYVPALQGTPIDQATLLHLGTYTAGGLPLQFPDEVPNDDAGAIAYLASRKPDARPGAERQYSNVSLGLLGYVAGQAMKGGFALNMETRLLPRLGMRHTHLRVPDDALADYAWGYRGAKPVRAGPGPFDEETYGIRTTAADLLRFVQANIAPSGLEPPLRRAVEATQVGYFNAGDLVQGLGWEQYPWPVSRERLLGGNSAEMIFDANPVLPLQPRAASGPRLFDKTGSTNGFGAYVAFVPERRIGIVMLANRNYPIPARVEAAVAILDKLAPG